MDHTFVKERITELRLKKGVSEYKMSLDLGHSKSYIQSISSGRSLPSLPELFYICDYFKISVRVFFDEKMENPVLTNELLRTFYDMKNEDLEALLFLAQRLKASYWQ